MYILLHTNEISGPWHFGEGFVFIFPILRLWKLSVGMGTMVLIRPGQKHNTTLIMIQIKFDPNWPSGLRNMYLCLKVQTDGHTDGLKLEYHPISSPREHSAQVS